ncbi:MAG: hypothetical protein K2M07_07035 [Muribaculaceae bacterium]|nr:hypothetical protein [Muribaculaceae bacterium]
MTIKSENFTKWCKINWWILLLMSIVVFSLIFSIFGKNHIIDNWTKTLTNILTPTSIILGLVLGYPLLKKKLTESYIAKQFDIMYNANRVVRAKCILLQDKYIHGYRSSEVTIEYITEAKKDILELRQLAIDAIHDVYRYINLIYRTLMEMGKYYSIFGNQCIFITCFF